MKFIPIFADEKLSRLWSVCFPEDCLDGELYDIFSILMDDCWSDTSYISEFVLQNQNHLRDPFWAGFTIDKIIDKILDERDFLDNELAAVVAGAPNPGDRTLKDIFRKLHDNIYSLRFDDDDLRKAKANVRYPIIRIYAIELEDETFVVTGGTLKLTKTMEGENFDNELKKLERVKKFLKDNNIIDRLGLIE
jgi:hypothetical protein